MDKNRLLKRLETIAPFSDLAEVQREQLARKVTEAIFSSETVVALQSKTRIDHVSIIERGVLEIYYDKEGERYLSGLLKPGDLFGGISILMNQGISLRSVTAQKDATVYQIPKRDFLELCSTHKGFHRHFVDIFTRRMRDESYAAVFSASKAFLFLSGIVPFSFLPEEELEKVAAALSRVQYPKDKILFLQGQGKIESLYIIEKGAAERFFEEDNEKKLSGLLGEGDLFGGISMLLNDGTPVRTFQTQEDTTFYTLADKEFFDLCNRYEAFSDYFTDTFGKRMLDRTYASIVTRTSAAPREEALQLFNQPVSALLSREVVSCDKDRTIQEAADIMTQKHCSSILVSNGSERYLGLVTDNDLRKKVIAVGYDIQQPITTIMSETLYTISEQSLILEALMEMMQHNIKHLAVTDEKGRVIGIVTNSDLLTAQGRSPFFLLSTTKLQLEVFL